MITSRIAPQIGYAHHFTAECRHVTGAPCAVCGAEVQPLERCPSCGIHDGRVDAATPADIARAIQSANNGRGRQTFPLTLYVHCGRVYVAECVLAAPWCTVCGAVMVGDPYPFPQERTA